MTTLQEGDKAPLFTAKDEAGKDISLSDFLGKKVVLYFYPKDNTPACTKQACNLRDNHAELGKAGYEVLGVSPDGEKAHQKFIAKFDLPFTLLVDTEKELANKYGVWGPKKFMGKEYIGIHRTTFVIDEKGTIERIIKRVITKDHSRQILEVL